MMNSNNILKPLNTKLLTEKSPPFLALKMLRPFYFICMAGYVFQIMAGIYNLYNLTFDSTVTDRRLALNGLAIFFSWMDMYTLTSTTRDTGIMSTAFVSILQNVRLFSKRKSF